MCSPLLFRYFLIFCCCALLGGGKVWGQKKTSLGINLIPLLVDGVDLQLERELTPNLSLKVGAGFRRQNRKTTDPTEILFLDQFIHPQNRSAFLSAGLRLFEKNPSEYPYLAAQVGGIYYRDTYLNADQELAISEGMSWGFAFTIGYVFNIGKRFALDLGMQLGYSPPREQPLFYFYPGFGFNTRGLDIIGYEGGIFQPVVVFSYTLVRDRRARIREQE
jgi:hypothetical protein